MHDNETERKIMMGVEASSVKEADVSETAEKAGRQTSGQCSRMILPPKKKIFMFQNIKLKVLTVIKLTSNPVIYEQVPYVLHESPLKIFFKCAESLKRFQLKNYIMRRRSGNAVSYVVLCRKSSIFIRRTT